MPINRRQPAGFAWITSLLTVVSLIAACGGGGGGAAAPAPPPLSSDASLSSLSVTDATLDPAFSSAVTSYAASVPNSTTSLVVTAATTDNNARLTINGGSNTTVALSVGDNTITVLVTAENGTSTRTYTVVITREPSSNANLSNLTLTNAALDPTFDPGVFNYSATVDFTVTSTQATPTAEDATATITANGTGVASGATSGPIALSEGDNSVNVVATAQDGTTTQSYTINVIRQLALAFSQEAYVKASNTDQEDCFCAVALSADGSTLAVHALEEDSAATGVNGDQTDNSLTNSGAVYVFTRDGGGVWTQQAYIKTSNPDADDLFFPSVALSANGSTLAVGAVLEDSAATEINGDQSNTADDNGAAYVFTRDGGGVWTQQAYVKASNSDIDDLFGWSVALSADGAMLAVGAVLEDSAATGVNGDQTDNSASGAGAVYVFTRDGGGVWTQQAYIKASNTDANDNFGNSVAFSTDGSTLAVGAQYEASIATGVNGDQDDNSSGNAGAVYVFTRDGGGLWAQQAYIKSSNTDSTFFPQEFGFRVALSADGSTLAVGAALEGSAATGVNGDQTDTSATWAGAVYVFTRDGGGVWAQQAYIKASNTDAEDRFGNAIAVSADGSILVVGAYVEDSAATGVNGDQTDNSASGAGAVYVFTRDGGGVWTQQAYIKASNTDAGDGFGISVSVTGDGSTFAVGAYEDSAATGVNGDETNNSAAESGAVYIFEQ